MIGFAGRVKLLPRFARMAGTLADIPTPPKDWIRLPTQDGLPTTLFHFVKGKGATESYNYNKEIYKINDIVRVGLPPRSMVYLFDPDHALEVQRAAGPIPWGSALYAWPFVKYARSKTFGISVAFTEVVIYTFRFVYANGAG
jgi:hypothetical protein